MPPVKKVPTLYMKSLESVFRGIFDNFNFNQTSAELEEARKCYIDSIPSSIRQKLIDAAIVKYCAVKIKTKITTGITQDVKDAFELKNSYPNQFLICYTPTLCFRHRRHTLNIINLLSDITTECIRFALYTTFLLVQDYELLLNILKRNNCIRLHTLTVKIISNESDDALNIIRRSNLELNYLLENGLSSNLRILTLGGVCTNSTLKVIGRNCLHLTMLNICSSKTVNDLGIEQLLLNRKTISSDRSMEDYITDLTNLDDNDLNPCCFTMTKFIFRDTTASENSIMMSLILVKNLASLGLFRYNNKTAGDALFTLSKCWKDESRRFKLKFLFDNRLSLQKFEAIYPLIPELSSLSIRCEIVERTNNPFKLLKILNVQYEHYTRGSMQFLEYNCDHLISICLRDQFEFINLASIMKSCPKVQYIEGMFTVDNFLENVRMNKLKKAIIKINSTNVLIWLLQNAPNLEILEIMVARYISDLEYIHSRLFSTLKEMKPSCLQTLTLFSIEGYNTCTVSRKFIQKFILACPKLQVFGNFDTLRLRNSVFSNLLAFIKRSNYNISMKAGNTYYPPVKKNPFDLELDSSSDSE